MGIGLLLIYFVYGLAFWIMGLAVLLESGRAATQTERNTLRWLSTFGIFHGTHEWLEAYLRVNQQPASVVPDWLGWLRIGLLMTSFACLLGYALNSLRRAPHPLRPIAWRLSMGAFVLLAAMFTVGIARNQSAVSWTSRWTRLPGTCWQCHLP